MVRSTPTPPKHRGWSDTRQLIGSRHAAPDQISATRAKVAFSVSFLLVTATA